MEGGPPMFRQDFTCPALLEDPYVFTHTGLSPSMACLSRQFWFFTKDHWPGPRSLATTNGVSVDVLSSRYLDVSVPRFASSTLCIQIDDTTYVVGFPIRKSADQSYSPLPVLFAACHVLHRLSVPRHPPNALIRLIRTQS